MRSISFSVISLIIYRLSPSRSWYTLEVCLTINWRSFHPLRGFWSTQNLLSLSELIKIISLQLILLKIFCLETLVIKNSVKSTSAKNLLLSTTWEKILCFLSQGMMGVDLKERLLTCIKGCWLVCLAQRRLKGRTFNTVFLLARSKIVW